MRATLANIKTSRIPEIIGVCVDDTARLAAYVNDAQERMIYAGGEAGWWSGWVRVLWAVTPAAPYITLPREFARIINLAVNQQPIYTRNEFYEVLPGGIGPIPSPNLKDWCGNVQGYERGVFPSSVDIATTNQKVRLYYTDVRDIGVRVLIDGLDQNSHAIYSNDGTHDLNGFYLTLAAPFVTSADIESVITRVVKPVTYGDVLLMQVDATTGVEVLLSRYKASETNPAYRRYYLSPLPSCCYNNLFNITSVCKIEYIPALRDSDQLIIGNIPALTEMIQSLRYRAQDTVASHAMAESHEKKALRLLRQELDHYTGLETPAVTVDSDQGLRSMRLNFTRNV